LDVGRRMHTRQPRCGHRPPVWGSSRPRQSQLALRQPYEPKTRFPATRSPADHHVGTACGTRVRMLAFRSVQQDNH
jgi:hypothetical protein